MPRVLVVGETPSLGRSIADLLDASGVGVEVAPDLAALGPPGGIGERFPVIVVASSGYQCPTARRWRLGELPGTDLVVVGSRDPVVVGDPRIRSVPLPVVPAPFVAMIRWLSVADPAREATEERGPEGGPRTPPS